jgi:hypothetical protein
MDLRAQGRFQSKDRWQEGTTSIEKGPAVPPRVDQSQRPGAAVAPTIHTQGEMSVYSH